MAGLLSLVATPIGNLDDITLRALRTLREADAILAEDTRRTGVLTSHHGIATRLRSLHAHTGDGQLDAIAAELAAGARFALVSDAGTPVVSDPGHALVERAVALGVTVEGIPGPSAVTTAVAVSGLPCDQFRFVGFLARTGSKRASALESIVHDTAASVFFEAPSRVGKTLSELAALAEPTRRAAACRELTKLHEEVRRGTLGELAAYFAEGARGEFTVVVEGAPRQQAPDTTEELEARAASLLAEGNAVKTVAKALAATTTLSRAEAYDLVLRVARPDGSGPHGNDDA
ncbi:MAG: 16S rRNA (cytidine(1402)-2'-O)-methyltransferase [Myxococcales bacterium]|nr:16S rRNA (cytidine(1402)-2'-O)-methyltransferase [Myxococcales bacterium]MCB9628024.1 16S rRNA (cytidine(1402)-2'-O)-methyltransferase [Sandaracinaceae bacterium]